MSYNNPTFVGDDITTDKVATLELGSGDNKPSNGTPNGSDKNQVRDNETTRLKQIYYISI